MGSEYLAILKKMDLDVVEAKIKDAPMIYKGIERLCGDLTPLWKKVEAYRRVVSAYLSLKKATSLCRHPTVVGQVGNKRPHVLRRLSLPVPSWHVLYRP